MAIKLPEDTELDESGEPLAPYEDGLNFIVMCLTVIESFIFALSIGQIKAVAHSPIIFFIGCIGGFLLVLVSWILGFLTFGLFGRMFSWVNSLFTLLKDDEFRAGVALLCFMFFISRVLAGILEKVSYAKKEKLCIYLLGMIAVNTLILYKLLGNEQGKYFFMYAIVFIPYVIVAYPRKIE